jgi:hypothetical protein
LLFFWENEFGEKAKKEAKRIKTGFMQDEFEICFVKIQKRE